MGLTLYHNFPDMNGAIGGKCFFKILSRIFNNFNVPCNRHFYPEFWINQKKKGSKVETTDIKKVEGNFVTNDGNEGAGKARGSRNSLRFLIGAKKGIPAHLDYFGQISSCDSTPPKSRKGGKN